MTSLSTFVLSHGRVVEVGPHDELLAAGGPYAALWATYTGQGEESEDVSAAS